MQTNDNATNFRNQQSRQNLNAMYLNQTGAGTTERVIAGFGRGWVVFALLSIIASTFSVFMDFVTGTGAIVAFIVAFALAIALEYFRYLAVDGAFSGMTPLSKLLTGVIAIGLLIVAIATHYRSLQTYEKLSIKEDFRTELNYQRDLQAVQNSQITSIIENNNELSKALATNGTTADDEISNASIKSNNELITTLATIGVKNNMANTNLILNQSQQVATQSKNALFLLFIIIEILAVFSIVAKVLLHLNTDSNVKELVTTIDKLNELESNVYNNLKLHLIEQSEARIVNATEAQTMNHEATMKSIINPPTPPITDHNQASKAQIAFNANMPTNPYLMGIANRLGESEEKNNFLPIINKRKPTNSGTRTETKEENKENFNNFEQDNVLDLMKFNNIENELIKMLFDNGKLGAGDKLIPKRFLLGNLPQTATERDLVNLYQKLEDHGAITFKNGYRANVSIVNEVKL